MFGWLILLLLVWGLTHFYLKGEDLSAYDLPIPSPIADLEPSAEHAAVVMSMGEMAAAGAGESRGGRLQRMRAYLDSMGEDVEFDGEIVPVDRAGIKGEWVLPKDCDNSCRTLYIHGGAFTMGSPLSHRAITTRYAQITGGAVLALDYRLMPESRRLDGVADCQLAYRWMLENSPQGREPASTVYVSGDSAGGSLALMVSAWARDEGIRAPNAVVALSPATDSTFGSPSWRSNLHTDPMLGPAFGRFSKIPRWLLLWASWFSARVTPAASVVSPLQGDLGGLPPTLVHASLAEMLLDDGVRYANKARASGSPVTLQTWSHMVHVWHIFNRELPEAQQAFDEIDNFLRTHRAGRITEAAA